MASGAAPKAPAGLGAPGRKLWRDVTDDLAEGWALTKAELAVLAQACRLADELALLEAAIKKGGAVVEGSRGQPRVNTCISEARAHRLALGRLLGQLRLEDPEAGLTKQQRYARHAALSRWGHLRSAGEAG